MATGHSMTVAGLFSGIGGLELGFQDEGYDVSYLCEVWEPARDVLRHRFPGAVLDGDIGGEDVRLPDADVIVAGFPCTDLSQVGRTAGITGQESGLVSEALDLVAESRPRWLLLENVVNLLHLRGGEGMKLVTSRLDAMGYDWAWRVVDSRSFGVPQRRRRVFLLASHREDPAAVLFGDDAGPTEHTPRDDACGFSWTEGNRGIGWAVDATPTLKGGSKAQVPSAPAVWRRESDVKVVVPSLRSCERLQGFDAGWTDSAPVRDRWKLLGNAVTVPVSRWIARRIAQPRYPSDPAARTPLSGGDRLPNAACSIAGQRSAVHVSEWPLSMPYQHLGDLLDQNGSRPLSRRATTGFADRLARSRLRFSPDFMAALRAHARVVE